MKKFWKKWAVTIIVGGIALGSCVAMFCGIYYLNLKADGQTQAQIEHRKRLQESLESAGRERQKYAEPFDELIRESKEIEKEGQTAPLEN